MLGQLMQAFVQREQVFLEERRGQLHVFEWYTLAPSDCLPPPLAPGTLDEDAPHGLACSGEESGPILPQVFINPGDQAFRGQRWISLLLTMRSGSRARYRVIPA